MLYIKFTSFNTFLIITCNLVFNKYASAFLMEAIAELTFLISVILYKTTDVSSF